MSIFSASETRPKSTSLLYAIDGAKSWITSKPDLTKESISALSIFARFITKSSFLLYSLLVCSSANVNGSGIAAVLFFGSDESKLD